MKQKTGKITNLSVFPRASTLCPLDIHHANRSVALRRQCTPERNRPMVLMLSLMLVFLVLLPWAAAASTQVHIIKYARDGSTIVNETTKDFTWMESHLPVYGDETTDWYLQGPVFSGDRWNPKEDTNLKLYGRNRGTDVRDLCDLAGGMDSGDTIKIWDGGYAKTFPYENVYNPDPRQGPIIIAWWFNGSSVPSFSDGMRLLFLADDHVYGIWDMNQTLAPEYQHFYYNGGSDPYYPTTTGLSVKYINEIVINSNDAPFTVKVPNGGQNWAQGTGHTITWNYSFNPGPDVTIELLRGNGAKQVIAERVSTGTAGTGSFVWMIPFNQVPGTDYRIRVSSTTNPLFNDTGNANFTISTGVPFTMLSPNGGENWTRGSIRNISWSYTGNPLGVKITLLKGGLLRSVITPNISAGTGGSGFYRWKIPFDQVPGTDYRIRISSISSQFINDTGNANFTISAGLPFTLLTPNGGENWTRGSIRNISWIYTGRPPGIRIVLMNGSVQNTVIATNTSAGTAGSGFYRWKVPVDQITGTHFRIRINSTASPLLNDTGNAEFTISSSDSLNPAR